MQIAVYNIDSNIEQQLKDIGISNIITFKESFHILNIINEIDLRKNNNPIFVRNEHTLMISNKNKNENCNILGTDVLLSLEYSAIMICMVGKTGDHTLMDTFNKNKILYHNPKHSPEMINKNILKRINKKIKIITAVREPISMELSALYHFIGEEGAYAFSNIIFESNLTLKNGGNAQEFFNFTCKRNRIKDFMNRFKENILDLSAYPFDKEKGYTIIKEGNIEVFVYQLERMNDIVKEMSDWVGQTPFDEWVMGNEASGKWIANSYKQAQKEIKFSQEYFDRCYNDPWVQHFYSQEDIEKFKERWRPHIKDHI